MALQVLLTLVNFNTSCIISVRDPHRHKASSIFSEVAIAAVAGSLNRVLLSGPTRHSVEPNVVTLRAQNWAEN